MHQQKMRLHEPHFHRVFVVQAFALAVVAVAGAAGSASFFGGLQSKHTNMDEPKMRLKDPLLRGL